MTGHSLDTVGHSLDSVVETSRLVQTLAGIGTGASVEIRAGQIRYDPTAQNWYVTSGGNRVVAIWNQGIVPYDFAQCLLLLSKDGNTFRYFVVCVVAAQPNTGITGKVTAFTAGQPTCTITIGGATFTANRLSGYTPTVGDIAVVVFAAGQAYALGALAVYTPPVPVTPPAVAQAPNTPTSGNSWIPAQDSGTWTGSVGGWNSYYSQNVYSGSGYVPVSTGAWFYNGGTLGLADKTNINRIRFWMPPRRQAGNYNVAATAHFYAHSSQSRGTTEPARVTANADINVPVNWGGDWIDLPLSFAATLQAGGGISIAGDPYLGFTGVGENGGSGALSIDWSK